MVVLLFIALAKKDADFSNKNNRYIEYLKSFLGSRSLKIHIIIIPNN